MEGIAATCRSGSATEESSDSGFNCYVPPGYEPLRMFQQHVGCSTAPAVIEQTNAYLEHRSALAYVAMCNEPAFVTTYRARYPFDELAGQMLATGGERPFKVIALGAGDGYLGATGSKPAVAAKSPDVSCSCSTSVSRC